MAEPEPSQKQVCRRLILFSFYAEKLSHEIKQRKSPKAWDITDDEFVYGPPKANSDPWNVLLKPLMEKDKIQCDAWKEEVQNLLIFAGLFSAVVTAFVTESYKALQPDPNDAIISLLSHIATRLDNQPGTVEPSSIAVLSSFSPTPSSIRVNIFWFLSLILSLTTVLVGTVTLQWLREYQSYPGLTPKQSLALFRMRSESMKKWYVWKIFTALPLLLQAALVLFFGGVIDFLLALDNKVAIPVSVVIGLTLLFLIATTVLPTLQGHFLYLPFLFVRDLSKEPSQCPYKSPQSNAFRAIFSFTFHPFDHVFPAVRIICQYLLSSICPFLQGLIYSKGLKAEEHHVVPRLLTTWRTRTWVDFDLAWLLLRDACVHGVNDQHPELQTHRHQLVSTSLPLFDAIRSIQEVIKDANLSHTENFRSAVYHCFFDMCKSVLQPREFFTHILIPDAVYRRNRYFHALGNNHDFEPDYEVTLDEGGRMTHRGLDALRLQNLFLFMSQIFSSETPHTVELQIRLMRERWGNYHFIQTSPQDPGLDPPLEIRPSFGTLKFHAYFRIKNMNRLLYWQYSHVIMAFFAHAASKDHLYIPPGCPRLRLHPDVIEFLKSAAYTTARATHFADTTAQDEVDLCNAYQAVFTFIGEQLNRSLSSTPVNLVQPEMSYLFYTSAIYSRSVMHHPSYLSSFLKNGIEALVSSMRQYKQKTNAVNAFLEEQLKGKDRDIDIWPFSRLIVRFTDTWWSFMDDDGHADNIESSSQQILESLNSEHLSSSHSTTLEDPDNDLNQTIVHIPFPTPTTMSPSSAVALELS